MHSAPSVEYPVGRCRFQARVLVALGSGAVLACLAWWVAAPHSASAAVLVLGVLALSAGLSWRNWQTTVQGRVSWDGKDWHWRPQGSPDAQVGWVGVHWHGQRCLLLGFVPSAASGGGMRRRPSAPVWLWLVADSDPTRWLDLRRAVYSRPGGSPSAKIPGSELANGPPDRATP